MQLKTFDALLIEVVEECFVDVLGKEAAVTIFQYLANYKSLSREMLSHDIVAFHNALLNLLGSMTFLLESYVIRILIQKLQIPIKDQPKDSFTDQIETIKNYLNTEITTRACLSGYNKTSIYDKCMSLDEGRFV
jgi:hypothetical protein